MEISLRLRRKTSTCEEEEGLNRSTAVERTQWQSAAGSAFAPAAQE